MSASKSLIAALLGLRWLLLPLVVIAAILFFGRLDFVASNVGEPDPAPELWAAVEHMTIDVELQQENGLPVRDAIVIFSAPELARAKVSDKGLATVTLMKADHVTFLAYAPGFSLAQGERDVQANGKIEPVMLQPIHSPDFGGTEPLVKLTRTVRLSDQQGNPLAALLVLARETGAVDSEPWVAISDLSGIATFTDATAADLHLDIYPAGFQPRLATRIGAIDVPADQQETPVRLSTARLEISGLPINALFEWKRLDKPQLLPLHRVNSSGALSLGPVAPGHYRLEIAGRRHDIQLEEGLTLLDFRQLNATPE
ncbi:MAG: hypothetical protein GY902_05675 [Planctomycetes bacterium]|nr:hypothetical protein [Planctomycetota bacterium]